MADKTLEQKDKRYHESFLKKTINVILVQCLIGISYLPFWILFGISDFFYLLLRHVLKYRYKIITENLTKSFPEKNQKEIKTITNKFYHHFCDVFFETIKSYSISKKKLIKRMKFNNINLLNEQYDKGRSIIILGMHYNNWEWNNFLQYNCKHKVVVIYNPLRGNQAFENFLIKIRTRWGALFVPVHKSRRIVFEIANMEIPAALALGADQTPPATSKLWTIFMNQETPFFSGPEKIAAHSNHPVFFHHTRKIKRGVYEVSFVPLFENPKENEPNEIILSYVKKMEEIIREEPAYYLWSHRRWKHSRPENISLLK